MEDNDRETQKDPIEFFLVVGHTKFNPDWCFGLFKRLYWHTDISCLNDIKDTGKKSAVCNTAQLVAEQDNTINVLMYNWLGSISTFQVDPRHQVISAF